MTELAEAALIALRDCLNLQEGEKVLVVTDPGALLVSQELFHAGLGLGGDPLLVEIPVRQRDGEEPPATVAEMMASADIVLAATTKSLTHTHARRNACKAGARVASLPGITAEIMSRAMRADYREISERSVALAKILTDSSHVRVRTPAGTDIEMSIEGRTCLSDTGLIHEKGEYSNLPAGEAYLAPIEGTSNGVIVVDGSMAGIGKLSEGETITLSVKDGIVHDVQGGEKGEQLRALIESVGKNGGNIAELGIGTNDKAMVSGVVLEDEKVLGTVHIAVGNNLSMGGSVDVPLHLDGVLLEPTVEVDGKTLLRGREIEF